MALTVADIMHADAPAVGPKDDVETVVRLLRDHGLHGVAVVDPDGRCVGIVTEADLWLRDEQRDLHLPHHLELMGSIIWLEPLREVEERLRKAYAAEVADLMTVDPVTIDAGASVAEAGRVISRRRHNRLPVVDGDGRYVGVVTRVDVLDALTREG